MTQMVRPPDDRTTTRRARTLAEVCDTLVPSVEPPAGEPAEFYARTAGDLGIAELLAPDAATGALLDALGERGFADAPLPERTALLRDWMLRGPHAPALRGLCSEVLGAYYSLPDAGGRNPNWADLGYPGPVSAPPAVAERLDTLRPEGDQVTLTADVCVVGSGAGGSVIAAELAGWGRSVLVVEAGRQWTPADFRQLEHDMAGMYLRGGQFSAEGGTIGLLAGSALGGGTVINSMVCLDPPAEVRAAWAAEHGLADVATAAFDEHLASVRARLNVNTERTVLAPAAEPMVDALDKRGLAWEAIARNCADDDDARLCGFCNAGCQQGSKQSTDRTYLRDAARAGARFLTGTNVRRILVDGGAARGVVGTLTRPDGSTAEVTVHAPTVVVAAGGIETPALLLRSGIGGPAVGRHLRLHPAYFVSGVYPREINAWSGQIQTAVSFAFHNAAEGAGFLLEHVTLSPRGWAAQLDWTDGAAHKREMRKLARVAPWHGVAHDHGSGEVVLDAEGEAVVRWRLADPVDRRVAALAHVELARLHHLAGAEEIYTFHTPELRWRAGQDFEEFRRRLDAAEHEGVPASAHQLGSARMGADPATSVADTRGQLHDVRGVWIGDAAAMPTSPAVNPMITTMALARRTAFAMAGERVSA
ncbi:GMC family oxidoreductase [Pseudonocardia eucalypti]|uniref:GMC family oxidoreductase n=1 Tax=Pseudonocardia eucalypti TaxID=648755 RepID=A0ABP9RGE5_9PSEU|nr:choline dehydrogenase-like flavoprotein [Pseudonocardia eucalypti]